MTETSRGTPGGRPSCPPMPLDRCDGNTPRSQTRVCFIISSFRPILGGAERRTERLCERMAAEGLHVVVLTRRYPGLPREEVVSGYRILRLGHQGMGKLAAASFATHALWLLATDLRQFRVIHTQSEDVPLLVGLIAKLLLRRSWIATIRSDPREVLRGMGPLRLALVKRAVDRVVGLSPEMVQQLMDLGISPSIVAWLPGGVDTSVFRPAQPEERQGARAELGISDRELVCLFVGRLDSVKRIDLLLRAWSSSQSVTRRRLLIVGAGGEESALTDLARRLQLKGVTFVGAKEDVLPYLFASDVFVLPSEWEGVSNALLEALAVGLPPLVSDVPGNRALVPDQDSGFLFEPGDVAELAMGLRALESDPLRRRLGERGTRFVRQHYSLAAGVGKHRRLYEAVLDGSNGRD
jgi:glycosyltransferase involved in cell wall biosynthesis